MQREPTQRSWTLGEMLSGLWHRGAVQRAASKKTVLLIPGPSSVDIRWMRRMVAVVSFSFFILTSGLACFEFLPTAPQADPCAMSSSAAPCRRS